MTRVSLLQADPALIGGKSFWRSNETGSKTVIALTGTWSVQGKWSEHTRPFTLFDRTGLTTLCFDATSLVAWDTSLLLFLSNLRRQARERGIAFDESGLPEPAKDLLNLLGQAVGVLPTSYAATGFVQRIGRKTLGIGSEGYAITALVGDTVMRSAAAVTGRARMRGVDLLVCMRDAGVSALPIVAIVNLLVGGILAFVGAVQLRRFGAVIYVANLVGVAVVREMAPLMTAIVMAGRTGGAYAAEIASMQGAEEIDALRAIGIPVIDYLILPRILALTAMMPMLYLYGSAVAIFGGMAVSVAMLKLAPASFANQLIGALSSGQILFGLGKSVCFGALIAIFGCRIGLKAGRSAADVGHAATSAVVTGIVGVIALDAVFAVCANAVGF